MLHAANKHKTRYWERYQGVRLEGETGVRAEDEIVSTVFGPLAFLPPAAIAAFWMAVVRWEPDSAGDPFPAGPVTGASMEFWPTRYEREPDLRVVLQWGETSVVILVELKWDSGLSPDQLQLQWNACLDESEKSRALHVFIGKDIGNALNDAAKDDVWAGRLHLLSWFNILTILGSLGGPGADLLQLWGSEVSGLLEFLGIRAFDGFSRLAVPYAPQGLDANFWCPFDGFAYLDVPDAPEGDEAMFFARSDA
ncbi:hypothetical protein HNP46_000529 [Pseudomonas nitritireducens]|uniref:Uncharacterized protein n=1 Tax=Pseudomonas nitroreducens TaxID=46680 RepID=A0A7W7KG92_PSENT|nr:hypothetical protein [Pseudomonas nitritireducens]MBB4861718.1 hypothetical protein [Pseudomonas nitritireducens]